MSNLNRGEGNNFCFEVGVYYLHIVVSEGSAEFVIIHIRLVLSECPRDEPPLLPAKAWTPIIRGPADHVVVLRPLGAEYELPQGDSTVHSNELKEATLYVTPPF